jgi:hypothetical protein
MLSCSHDLCPYVNTWPVTIGGIFKGLLLSSSTGSFDVSESEFFQAVFCSGRSAITHTDGGAKSDPQVLWTSPASSTGPVVFNIVVVEEQPTDYFKFSQTLEEGS